VETLLSHLLQNSCFVYLTKPIAGSATSTFFTVEIGVITTKWFCSQCTIQGKGASLISFSKENSKLNVLKPICSAASLIP
jgi:hypothetical protein